MDSSKKTEFRVKWSSLRLVERYMNVLYPFDLRTLLVVLPTIGYVVPQKRLKGVMEAGEPIAVKGNLELLLNPDNKTLGVEGRVLSEVIDGFTGLREFCTQQLNPSPQAVTHYVELGGEGVVQSANNPVKTFGNFWDKSGMMRKLSDVVEWDVVNYGMRLVPRGKDPNNVDWFDLRVQPDVISSGNKYYVSIVWRSGELDSFLKGLTRVEEMVADVIREVEKR